MKIALISDIHSNLQALNVALRSVDSHRVDAIYCLGDIVGYGADPSACVELVRRYCKGVVLGNHDLAVATGEGLSSLPRDGQTAAKHNRTMLNSDQISYLTNLPLTLVDGDCTFVHATPKEPAKWVRFDLLPTVREQFSHFHTKYCFVGHTHIPALVSEKLGVFRLKLGVRYIINSGSVGQPRDENSNLSFVVFDTEDPHLETVRLKYDVAGAANRIREEGLPQRLGDRLAEGR